MDSHRYDWTRYCVRLGGSYRADEHGFLADPATLSSFWLPERAGLLRLDEADDVAVAVLLGEPGIGKTETLRGVYERLPGWKLWVDLGEIGGEDALHRALDESTEMRRWLASDDMLELFFDALDEGREATSALSRYLGRELERLSRERLRVRIGCRTAEWPPGLGARLSALFPTERVEVLELLPLRRADVRIAAATFGVDGDAFLAAVEERDVVAFARTPVTLDLLLRLFSEDGTLAESRTELYRRGCLKLASEFGATRRESGLVGHLSATERFAIAERLAAASVFGNATGFVIDDATELERPSPFVHAGALSGGFEVLRDGVALAEEIPVTVAAIRETLRTGLFSGRGEGIVGWAHETLAEYLAARYLLDYRLGVDRIARILVHPSDPSQRVVPQLHGVAGWLAALDEDVFIFVLEHDPAALLNGDVATATDERKRRVVDALIELAATAGLVELEYAALRQLAHAGLADQLRPYFRDRASPESQRLFVIRLAHICDVAADDLANLTLDPDEDYELRAWAALAVRESEDVEARARLRRLALGLGFDPDDELRGSALIATFPGTVTLEEVLPTLQPPQGQTFTAYSRFLGTVLVERLATNELPTMLDFATELIERHGERPFRTMLDELVQRAWRELERPGVPAALGRLVASLLARYHEIVSSLEGEPFASQLREDDQRRRTLLRALVDEVVAERLDVPTLALAREPLVLGRDIPWLIEQLDTPDSLLERTWASLIEATYTARDRTYVVEILEATEAHPHLRELLAWAFDAVALDSDRSRHMRKIHDFGREPCDPESTPEPPTLDDVAAAVERSERGDQEGWMRIFYALVHNPAESPPVNILTSELAASPLWRDAPAGLRNRVLDAAERFLAEVEPRPQTHGALAGFAALRLLFREGPTRLEALTEQLWRRWASTVLGRGPAGDNHASADLATLITFAFDRAPAAATAALEALIEKENADHGDLFVLHRLTDVRSGALDHALLAKARDPNLAPVTVQKVLMFLLERGIESALELARDLIVLPPPNNDRARKLALAALALILRFDATRSWETFRAGLESDPDFAREIVAEAVGLEPLEGFRYGLAEDQLVELYLLLDELLPAGAPEAEGDRLTIERRMWEWRTMPLDELARRETWDACAAIAQIVRRRPEQEWLLPVLARAEARTRRVTWPHPTPQQVIRLVTDPRARFVTTGDQLLDIVVEQLQRLERKIRGELPLAELFWDQVGEVWRPKGELPFAQWIAAELQAAFEASVFVNREVEVSRAAGASLGSKIDIRADVAARETPRSQPQRLTAVIEVKGCWDRNLLDGLNDQLVDDYLRTVGTPFGVYVVGDFASDKWDPRDRARRNRCAGHRRENAAAELQRRARLLADQQGVDVRVVVLDLSLPTARSRRKRV